MLACTHIRIDIIVYIEKDEEKGASTRDGNETNVYFQNKYLRERGIKRAKMCFLFDLRLYFSFRSNSLLLFLPLALAAIAQTTTQPLTYSRLAFPSSAPAGGQEAGRQGQYRGHKLQIYALKIYLYFTSLELGYVRSALF